MKTSKLLFLAIFGLACLFGNAQNNFSTTTLTSGGNTAGGSGTGAYYGYKAGTVSTASSSTFIGNNSGKSNTTGNGNTFLGNSAGASNLSGISNVYVGFNTGFNSLGSNNTFTGMNAGSNTSCSLATCTTTGNSNSFYGSSAGSISSGGDSNSFFGAAAGNLNTTGGSNTFLGAGAGFKDGTGSGNVLIGTNAGFKPGGFQSPISNQLFIDNQASATPLIWGDFSADQIKLNGKVGIGFGTLTTFPTMAGGVSVAAYNLFVGGGILTEEVRVNLRNGSSLWADYVFNKDYNLKSLPEVEKFIADNGHLPNVPSAKEVKANGIELGEMAKIQQEKIEELTLYLIQQNKELAELKAQVKALSEKK